ncbi:tetratricopeptide repeat protein [Kovacikia minuta CCNUW1]|uniref:tetratricopeptide repeat protein n=1 Tax=Kovacikia minuta TaxID=2931930 RepID=UPI001CCBFC84|nr:tetratricopeptide repeat protein [Kovacikia minuta]UBF28161.1 tetratricopeptide repeat protein [Kovacikia minuta CCNUW1]
MGASISVDHDSFATEVIERSYEKPVLVDFFATWCGPCQMLKPILEKLVQEYDFVLAKVDIDQNPDLAQTYGVQGVPDVKVVVDGQVSEGFVGVLPESQLRQLLAQLNLKSVLDEALETIYTEASLGNVEKAKSLLEDLLQHHSKNPGVILEAANFYLEVGELETAEKLLEPIQEYEKEYFVPAKTLKALILFKRSASQPGGNHELDQQFRQAVQAVLEENYKLALQQFLAIVSQDRRYKDDGARKAMLAIFDILGDDHPLTKDYRKQLTRVLY